MYTPDLPYYDSFVYNIKQIPHEIAIVEHYKPSELEAKIAMFLLGPNKLDHSLHQSILNHLENSLRESTRILLSDRRNTRVLEFRVKKNDKAKEYDDDIIAGFMYYQNQRYLDFIVFPRKGKRALIIYYKKIPINGDEDWKDTQRVDKIYEDTDGFEKELKENYRLHKKIEQEKEFKRLKEKRNVGKIMRVSL